MLPSHRRGGARGGVSNQKEADVFGEKKLHSPPLPLPFRGGEYFREQEGGLIFARFLKIFVVFLN